MLRAGLGMADAALALLPESSMGFVGLARDEETFEPRAYLESLPGDLAGMPVLVLDPMLATGGSLEHCCRLLADRGCTDITVICVLAAPERHRAAGARPACRCAWSPPSIDEGLNEQHVHRARPRRRRRPPVRRHAPVLTAPVRWPTRRVRAARGCAAESRETGRPGVARRQVPSHGAVGRGCAQRYRLGP